MLIVRYKVFISDEWTSGIMR